jgi:Right handed beta helix region/Bacterial Ig domain
VSRCLTLLVFILQFICATQAQVTINPSSCSGQCIQTAVTANPPGTTFVLGAGTFYNQEVVPLSGDTFNGAGEGLTILNGAIQDAPSTVVRSTVNSVTYWTAPGPSTAPSPNGACDSNFPLCGYENDLLIDCPGANCMMFTQVPSIASITAGTAYFSYSTSLIYFPLSTFSSPTGHIIEYSYTGIAFKLSSTSSNVTIENMTIEKYATPAQIDAVGGNTSTTGIATGFVVNNVESCFNHGSGIGTGDSGQIINSYSHNNGWMGMESNAHSNVLMSNNEISFNNAEGFSVNWAAGGIKNTNLTNGTLIGNNIHDNNGDGIWCDASCSGMTYQNNIISNNAGNGIAHEISHAASMSNNVILGNGWGLPWGESTTGDGLNLANSDGVSFNNNFVANNDHALYLDETNRTCEVGGAPYVCALTADNIYDNTVVQNGRIVAELYSGLSTFDPTYYTSDGNYFTGNQYCVSTSTPSQTYWWITSATTQGYNSHAQWQAGTPAQYFTPGNDKTDTFTCPRVFIQSPLSGTSGLASSSMVISAFAADAAGTISSIALNVDGTALTPVVSTAYNYPSVPSASFTGQEALQVTYTLALSSLTAGSHTIQAVATNSAGQIASSEVQVTAQAVPDFQVSATTPVPASVAAGGSVTSTIMVESVNNFSGSVGLACSAVPAGANCSFNPSTVSVSPGGAGTSTLTIATSSSTAANSYSLSVAGTSGALTGSATITLEVTSVPADFEVRASALSPATVTPGAASSSTITVTSLGGFNLANVALFCTSITLNGSPATSLPPACSFGSISVANGVGTATLTVTTTAATARLAPSSMWRPGVLYAMWLPIGGIAFMAAGFSLRREKLLGLLLIGLMASGLIFLAACGGGSNKGGSVSPGTPGTPAGTYSITVAGTSGPIQHNATLTLNVQ